MVSFIAPDQPPQKVSQDMSKPPIVVDVIAGIIQHWLDKNRALPECMPKGEYHAANWWLNLMEDPHPFLDTPEPVRSLKTGEITGWRTPYHDRVSYLMHRYLRLDEPYQAFISEYIGKGVPWRGEPVDLYADICREHGNMLKNRDQYICNSRKVLSDMGIRI